MFRNFTNASPSLMYKITAIAKGKKKGHALSKFSLGLTCLYGCLDHWAARRHSMGSMSLSHLPDKSRSAIRVERLKERGHENYGTRLHPRTAPRHKARPSAREPALNSIRDLSRCSIDRLRKFKTENNFRLENKFITN